MNAPYLMTAVLLAVGVALGQQTWKVNCQGGPGIDFTDLPQAVAAAAPGDTIWVFTTPTGCPGMGAPPWYTATTIDKPLNILGFAIYSTTPPPGSGPTLAGLQGVVTINGIAAGERVVISGVAGATGLHMSNCAGEVVLEYLVRGASGQGNEVLTVQNCAEVTIHGGVILYGGTSLNITNSTVAISGLQMISTAPATTGGYSSTTPAITLTNSTLTITDSLIEGSWGYPGLPQHQPAVRLVDSTMYLGPGSNLFGGWALAGGWTTAYTSQSPVPSYVYLDPRTVTSGSSGSVTTIPQWIHATYLDFAVANDWTTVTFAGPSNGFALLLLGDLPLQPTLTPFGSLNIDPNVMLIDFVALPGGSLLGFMTKDYFLPAAAQNAHAYSIQSLTLSPTGMLGLTMATPFCVGWEHGRVP